MLGTVISWNSPQRSSIPFGAMEQVADFIMWVEMVSIEEHEPGLKAPGGLKVFRMIKRDPAPLTWFSYHGIEVNPR